MGIQIRTSIQGLTVPFMAGHRQGPREETSADGEFFSTVINALVLEFSILCQTAMIGQRQAQSF